MKRRLLIGAAAVSCAAAAGIARAQQGVSDREIVLGQSGILSGPLGPVVKEFNAGVHLAFGHANSQGGVAGRQVRLVSLDDELKPELAVANHRKLLAEHQVFAFFGCVGSGTTAAAAEVLRSSGVPSIGCYAVADSVRQKVRGLAYCVRASTSREAQRLLQHIKTIGMTRVAAVGLDNAGGKEVNQIIERAAAAEGLAFAGSATVKPDGSNAQDAGFALAKLAPHALLMYLSGDLPVKVITAMRDAGSATLFFGTSIVQGQVLARDLGLGARGVAIAQVMPYPWHAGDPEIRAFASLAEGAGVAVNYTSFEGYLNARVMLETLARAGRALTREKVVAALRTLRGRLAGIDIDFTDPASIAGSRFVELVMVTPAGRYVR
jgi:branched-chain amino acid transport system substrate-binding protein